MTADEFANAYIGRPYEKAGLHCWELVRRCQAEAFGRDLPAVLEAPDTARELARLMARRDAYSGWHSVETPQHGAVVFMTRAGYGPARSATHSGVYLALDGGGVLHTDEPHGVVFETFAELRAKNWSGFGSYIPD